MKNTNLSSSELKLTGNMDASVTSLPKKVEEDTVVKLERMGSDLFTLMEDDEIKPVSATDQIQKLRKWMKNKIKRSFTKKMLLRRIPILTWLPKYTRHDAVGDMVAGMTVGLTVIPQAIAYSSIAGLPPQCLASLEIGPKDPAKKSSLQKLTTKSFWVVGTSRNAILVVLSGFLGYFFVTQSTALKEQLRSDNSTEFLNGSLTVEESPFILTGFVPSGLPEFKVPAFGFERDGTHVSFISMISDMGLNLLILPLIALLENIAICKAFSSGKPVDATQELIAMGICNIGNSFMQAFPGSGSLSRSAVNNASGVRTPLGGLYTGIIVVVALFFFTPYFYYIPKSTLAAVIIAAVIFMVEVKVVKPMWRTKKSDLIPGFGTFLACLVLNLQYGILLGIIIQILFLLYNAARPKIHMQKLTTKSGIEYLKLTPDRCLIFPSVDYVRNIVTKHSIKQGIPVVIDCSHIYGADFTAAKVIESLSRDFVLRKQPLLFYNLKSSVFSVFEGLQPQEFVTFYEHDDLDELLRLKVFEKANS